MHWVPDSDEWNVHRNLNVPVWVNLRVTGLPTFRLWLNCQFPPYAVTVCEPVTAFHLIMSFREIRIVVGVQVVDMAFTIFVSRVGTARAVGRPEAGAAIIAMSDAVAITPMVVRMRGPVIMSFLRVRP